MNSEQGADDLALDRLLDKLTHLAVAEIQALEGPIAASDEVTSAHEVPDADDEERYFKTVARPLGEAVLSAQLLGSTLINEDRGA